MIGKLTGVVDSVSGNQMILDVGGVGYLISCSAQTMRLAGERGNAATLWIETLVREDALVLVGFSSLDERDWFRLLTSVQGVGVKAALSVLGILSPDALATAIAAQDKGPITAADGVGPKLATRIITELKDKVAHFILDTPPSKGGASARGGVMDDALSALAHLGYRRMEAFSALSAARAKLDEKASLDVLLRAALAELSRRKEGA